MPPNATPWNPGPGEQGAGRPRRGRTRRNVLGASATGALGLLAGCLGGDQPPTIDHPAAADLRAQPRLGPPIDDSESTIIVFEDPSCPVCRIFEERTFPQLEESLVDPGRTSFVSRGFLAAAPWGRQGLNLLESTFAREEAAFWGLRAALFANQGQVYSEETLYEVAREFLATETSLNADRIVRDARSDRFEGAVNRDVTAARDAGVRGTPTFFLFESGSYLTKIEGAPSYELLENAFGY